MTLSDAHLATLTRLTNAALFAANDDTETSTADVLHLADVNLALRIETLERALATETRIGGNPFRVTEICEELAVLR